MTGLRACKFTQLSRFHQIFLLESNDSRWPMRTVINIQPKHAKFKSFLHGWTEGIKNFGFWPKAEAKGTKFYILGNFTSFQQKKEFWKSDKNYLTHRQIQNCELKVHFVFLRWYYTIAVVSKSANVIMLSSFLIRTVIFISSFS